MYDQYQGLIFDMDGTLLNTEPSHFRAWQQTLAKYDLSYDKQAMIALNGTPTWKMAKFILDNNQSDIDPHALAAEKMALVEQFLFDETKVLPLIEVVKSYHGRRPMAVGTGSIHRITDALLTHLGLRHYFDAIVCADDVDNHKPAPDTFLRCAKLINVAPEKCVVFEDADFGLEAAKRAGMDVVDVRGF